MIGARDAISFAPQIDVNTINLMALALAPKRKPRQQLRGPSKCTLMRDQLMARGCERALDPQASQDQPDAIPAVVASAR